MGYRAGRFNAPKQDTGYKAERAAAEPEIKTATLSNREQVKGPGEGRLRNWK